VLQKAVDMNEDLKRQARFSTSSAPRAISRDHNSQEWSAGECLRVLYCRKGTILGIILLAALGSVLITGAHPKIYQSRASLEIQAFNENFLNLRDVYPSAAASLDPGMYMQTQLELLQQDSLIDTVILKMRSAGALTPRRQDIKVVPVRNSRIIQVVCDSRDPAFAASLANTFAQTFIDQAIENRQHAARLTYEALQVELDGIRHEMLRQKAWNALHPNLHQAPDRLSPEESATHRLYQAMLQKANDARVASIVRQSNIRLIAPAQPAPRPYKPNPPLSLAIAIFGGLLVAVACVLLQEQNISVLHAPGDAGACLGLPELGAIPNAAGWNLSLNPLPDPANLHLQAGITALQPQSSELSESFRSALASILSRDADHLRSLVVTSSYSMEGKTTVVSNLGMALAELGGKVLLIDGDMRRPQLHRVFDRPNLRGLSDALRATNAGEPPPLDGLIATTALPNLYLLPSGASPENIPVLLNSNRMSGLLARLREEFDYVLVDAPPCLKFADARSLARQADGMLFVVRANHTDRKSAQAAVQRLECNGLWMGVILNRWDPSSAGSYSFAALRNRRRLGVS
jgi:receptor protein-tyrosine kinase